MTDRRAKIAAGATVVGLAALGGAALGSNPGMPVSRQVAGVAQGGKIVTSASGATAVPAAETGALHRRAPIVTRASGGGLAGSPEND
jgi:hypothetical protein